MEGENLNSNEAFFCFVVVVKRTWGEEGAKKIIEEFNMMCREVLKTLLSMLLSPTSLGCIWAVLYLSHGQSFSFKVTFESELGLLVFQLGIRARLLSPISLGYTWASCIDHWSFS